MNLSEKQEPITFCSRPVRLHGFWKPRPADVAKCDRLVEHYLGPSTKRLPRGFIEYHRQYLGIERDGRRVLYVNAFFAHDAAGPAMRKELVNACDGGDIFWGLVCDSASATISEFEMNRGF